jgi:uncharacterized membrane protein
MLRLELTDEEALSLRNLLDVAVRAAGMRAAEFAVIIDKKIVESVEQSAKSNGKGVYDVRTNQ